MREMLLLSMRGAESAISDQLPSYMTWLPEHDGPVKLLPLPMTRSNSVSLAARHVPGVDVRTIFDWLSLDGERPLAYMERYLHGLHYTPETLRTLWDDYTFDGIVVFKGEASVWDGELLQTEPRLLFSALGDSMALVREDEHYGLYWRSSS